MVSNAWKECQNLALWPASHGKPNEEDHRKLGIREGPPCEQAGGPSIRFLIV